MLRGRRLLLDSEDNKKELFEKVSILLNIADNASFQVTCRDNIRDLTWFDLRPAVGVWSFGSDSGISSSLKSDGRWSPGQPTHKPFPLITTGATAVTKPPALKEIKNSSLTDCVGDLSASSKVPWARNDFHVNKQTVSLWRSEWGSRHSKNIFYFDSRATTDMIRCL